MASGMLNLKKGIATDADLRREVVIAGANGAVAVKGSCTVLITKTGSLAALTLAAPSAAMDGVKVDFVAVTAFAHTVTNASPGFNNAGASGDVATFTAAAGNSFSVIAYGGVWYAFNLQGVALA